MSLAPGQTFAGYAILQRLGAGAMGEVYLAEHPRLPRRDALKVLAQEVSADPTYRERFNREAQNAATLSHPNIVAVYDRGEDEGQLWISMAYVEGIDASRLLQERYHKGMPPDEVVPIIARGRRRARLRPSTPVASPRRQAGQHPYGRLGFCWLATMLADFGIARRVDDSSSLTQT